MGIVSAHHGPNGDITMTSDTTANGIWAMIDKLFMPAGAPYSVMTGWGFYLETYEKSDGSWKIKTLRIQRTRVEAT